MTPHLLAASSTVAPSQPSTIEPKPGANGLFGFQGVIIAIAVLWVVIYFISLKVHPFTKCRACKGKARHHGAVFTYAFRLCTSCKGTGRQLRLGSRLFGGPR